MSINYAENQFVKALPFIIPDPRIRMPETTRPKDRGISHTPTHSAPISRYAMTYRFGMTASYALYSFLAWTLPNNWWTWLWGAIVVGVFCGKLSALRIVVFCLVPVFIGWASRNWLFFNNTSLEWFRDLYSAVLPQSLLYLTIAFLAERARHYRLQYNNTALVDLLTGLGNLRLINEQGEKLWQLLSADNLPCSVLFIDCDSLKAINDQLGHDVGDQYLIQVAMLLEKFWSNEFLVARRSGDEFIVISALSKHEDLQNRIQAFLAEPIIVPDGCSVQAGFSIGAAICSPVNCELKDAIRKAESAMYKAKQLGKNQFVIENKNE